MTLPEIIAIMENRVINLEETRKQAFASGLIDQIVSIDADLATTKISLEALHGAVNAINSEQ